MIQNASFIRKVIYGCAIVLLLFPLFLLGQPATHSSTGTGSAGGVLARMRSNYGLSQAELGKIDPASETMKMATLGLRGVATAILWGKADRYKRTESWDKLSATLNQIAKLQPNYITVWEFQAHNLSYNVSTEFDNYRHRYHWVKKGIEFLIEGTQYNRRNPRLYWNLGWFTGHKLGMSDERVQFRRMFPDDTDFHSTMVDYIDIDNARGPDGKPDNWLVSYLWYLQSEAVVDKGVPITWLRVDPENKGLTDKRRSSVIFYSDPSMALIDHAEAITGEITPGEKTRNAWRRAGREWDKYGNMDVPTTWGHTLRLNSLDAVRREEERMREKLEALSPGLREKIRQQRHAQLTPLERTAFDGNKPHDAYTNDEMFAFRSAFEKMTVTDMDVADGMPEELRAKAHYYARRASEANVLSDRVASYRQIVNFDYWKTRCEVEQSKVTAEARRYMMLGDKASEKGAPEVARKNYELAWDEWDGIFKKYPQLVHDVMADDLRDAILRYKLVLDQLDEEFPRDFKLKMLIESDEESQSPSPAESDGDSKPGAPDANRKNSNHAANTSGTSAAESNPPTQKPVDAKKERPAEKSPAGADAGTAAKQDAGQAPSSN